MKGVVPKQREAFALEMAIATRLERAGRLGKAFAHLERAHVLGQAYVIAHTRVHWRMFLIACRRRDLAAAWGQGLRVVLGALGSALGLVPTGNTGGTNISMFARLPIPPDLEELMKE